jgi:hypothetical protein
MELFFIITLQKSQLLSCLEGVFTAPFYSNGNYSIVASLFIAAGMCLPIRCLAINVNSDFTIPAFGHHQGTLLSERYVINHVTA